MASARAGAAARAHQVPARRSRRGRHPLAARSLGFGGVAVLGRDLPPASARTASDGVARCGLRPRTVGFSNVGSLCLQDVSGRGGSGAPHGVGEPGSSQGTFHFSRPRYNWRVVRRLRSDRPHPALAADCCSPPRSVVARGSGGRLQVIADAEVASVRTLDCGGSRRVRCPATLRLASRPPQGRQSSDAVLCGRVRSQRVAGRSATDRAGFLRAGPRQAVDAASRVGSPAAEVAVRRTNVTALTVGGVDAGSGALRNSTLGSSRRS